MVTILRIPVYLEIETGNIERAKVTKAMQELIIPQVVKGLVSVGNKFSFSREEVIYLQNAIGPFSCKMLTDVDVLGRQKP